MKKNKIVCMVALLFFVVLMSSCGTGEEKYLTRFEKFVNGVCESVDQLSSADWESVCMDYESYMEEYNYQYMSTFTPEENRQFGKLKARIDKVFLKVSMDMAGDYLDAGSHMMNGYLEEMGNDLDDLNIDEYVNDAYEDIESVEVDEFVEAVEEEIDNLEFDF